MVKVYEKAPEFSTQGYYEGRIQNFALKDYLGKWVVLFFYPLDFTFVCPTELRQFSEKYEQFRRLNTQVMSVSVDSPYSHEAWSRGNLGQQRYPMVSDLNHSISRAYGAYLEERGIALRATYIINPDGIVHWASYNPLDVGRSADEVLRVLTALQTGELCEAGWKPGQETLTQKMKK